MPHSHAPAASPSGQPNPANPGTVRALAVMVLVIAALAAITIGLLWPSDVPRGENPYGAEGVSLVEGTVTAVRPFDCNSRGMGPDSVPNVDGYCARVTATSEGERATFVLDPTRYVGGAMEVGDDIRMIRLEPPGQPPSWEFRDHQRGWPLILLAVVFAALVVGIARWRGLLALVGIAVTVAGLLGFVVPALLAGRPAIPVVVAGSTAIMIAVLYLAHGISVRTTSALFGTLIGIVFTAAVGVAATGWASLTGIGSEDDHLLVATAPGLSLSGVVAASMVIAGLGVLNDVTITQASAVWELRASSPSASRRGVFSSAMRIGRDHIASSVYTLVFAYAGSAMTVMLLITAYQPGLVDVATSEQLATEIVRTLVGAIGLVLAVPITTLIAVRLAPAPHALTSP